MNPSFRKGEKESLEFRHGPSVYNFDCNVWKERNGRYWDTYWGPIRNMLIDEQYGINLMHNFDYLDIFHFREQNQRKISIDILSRDEIGKKFIVEELNLTQHIIEDVIKPKLIIVKNKESWAYWGKEKDKGFIWMGYDFVKIRDYECGQLYKIVGLLDSTDRIAPEITNENTSLKGTLVLFTRHINQYTKREERPTAVLLNELLSEATR